MLLWFSLLLNSPHTSAQALLWSGADFIHPAQCHLQSAVTGQGPDPSTQDMFCDTTAGTVTAGNNQTLVT